MASSIQSPFQPSRTSAKAEVKRDRVLEFEPLEPRILFAADPVATVENLPAEEMVNEEISFDIKFDNQGTDTLPGPGSDATGYKPYVDFVAPPEMAITGVEVFGSAANNPDGPANIAIGEIDVAGNLVALGSSSNGTIIGTAIDHPEYAGNPPTTFGTIGSATAPVLFNLSLAGYNVYSVSLPFGSYSENNPPLNVSVTANINTADGVIPHTNLDVFAQGGFAYGVDPLNNPTTDTPIVGAGDTEMIEPLVINLSKTASVREEDGPYTGESVSGPNHPLTYTLTVDIANLETVDSLTVTDLIPDDLAYLGNLTVTGGGAFTVISTPFVNTDGLTGTPVADNLLSITFASVTGGATDSDIVITYQAFVPYVEGDGITLVIDPVGGDQNDLLPYNDSAVSGTYNFPSGAAIVGDNKGPANPDPAEQDGNTDYRIEEHSIATQKSVTLAVDNNVIGLSTFDVLEYQVDIQVSDYFAIDQLTVTDTLGDGQVFWGGAAAGGIIPQLTFQMHGNNIVVNFDPGNFTVVPNAITGETVITFNVSQQLIDSGFLTAPNDQILGGLIPQGGIQNNPGGILDPALFNAGATLGSIRFRAQIDDKFINGDNVGQGDTVGNQVVINAQNLDISDLTQPGGYEAIKDDDSTASSEIGVGNVNKSVYSVTDRSLTVWYASSGDPIPPIATGDVITYLVSYDLPITRFQDLILNDFLPQPAYDVNLLNGVVQPYSLATFNAPNTISYGAGDTFYGAGGPLDGSTGVQTLPGYSAPATPIYAFSVADNGFRLTLGDYDAGTADPVASRIEFLVSVQIQDAVFEDGLLFTNQVGSEEKNSPGDASDEDDIAGGIVTGPKLQLDKGIVSTTNGTTGLLTAVAGPTGVIFNLPGSASAFSGTISSEGIALNPIDSDITDLDAGDVVTFVITVENLGKAKYGVFDITVEDLMPAEYEIPSGGLNLRVTDGAGNTITYTGNLFAGGITFDDPSNIEGAIAGFDGTSGTNIAIIAYDLELKDEVQPLEDFVNTAQVTNYASGDGNANYVPTADPTVIMDDATVTVRDVTISKRVVSTSFSDTNNQDFTSAPNASPFPDAAIGEVIRYEVTVTFPEGTLQGARVWDVLQEGLAFVDLVGVTASGVVTDQGAGDFSDVEFLVTDVGAVPVGEGRRMELGFGGSAGLGTLTIAPSTTDAGDATLTIVYDAVLLNTSNNNRGNTRQNNAQIRWTNDDGNQTKNDRARVRVVEPNVTVDKVVSAATAEGDDVLTYTITIRNVQIGSNTSEAFEVELVDILPTGVSYDGNLSYDSGVAPDLGSLQISGGILTATFARFGVGDFSVISFDVRVDQGLAQGTVVTNNSDIEYTSLPDTEPTSGITVYNTLDVERTGDPANVGGAVNDYNDTDPAAFIVISLIDVAKLVVDTSEAHTLADSSLPLPINAIDGAIGEVIRYEVALEIPRASFSNVQLVDTLDAGLFWIPPAANNVELTFLGFSNLTNIVAAGDLKPAVLGDPVTINPSRISDTTDINGNTLVAFDLGDIQNLEPNGTGTQFILLSYNVIVKNDVGSAAGDVLTNSIQARVAGADVGPPLTRSLTVVEPAVTISKSDGGVTTADAGDVITYTLTVTAANGANNTTAFDLDITDAIPDELEYVAASLAIGSLPAYATVGTQTVVGQNLQVTVDELRKGDSFTITFDVKVRESGVDQIRSGQLVNNQANIAYSSLPGAGTPDGDAGGSNQTGSSAGTPGNADGERLYSDNNSDSFTAPTPIITKVFDPVQPGTPLSNAPTAEATIGEEINYLITITVPEGVTGDPVAYALDTVAAGLSYVAGSLSVTLGGGVTVATVGVLDDTNATFFTRNNPGATSAETLQFDFDRINFITPPGPALDGLATGTIQIRYTLKVDNIIGNQAALVLGNEADFIYSSGNDPGVTDQIDDLDNTDTDVTVVEPNVAVSKTASPITGDAGDVISYTVVIENDATETAYDILFEDILPANLLLSAGTFSVVGTGLASGVAVADFNVTTTGVTLTTAGVDLASGNTITITYDAVIQQAVVDGDSLVNNVEVEWSSLNGNVTGERTGDGLGVTGTDPVNNYEDRDNATVTVNLGYSLAKTVLTTSEDNDSDGSVADDADGNGQENLTIGEEVTFRVVATLGEGTTRNVVITDTLPDNAAGQLVFVSAQIATIGTNVNLTGFNVGDAPTSVVGNLITWSLGDVTVDGTNGIAAAGLRQITFDVVARVSNVIENQSADTLTNNARLTSTDGETRNASEVIDVVEPALAIGKVVTIAGTDAGDAVVYTLTITNASGPAGVSTAFDVRVRDLLDTNLELINVTLGSGIVVTGAIVDTNASTIANLDITLDEIAPGDTVTVVLNAVVKSTAASGTTIDNTASITYTSLDGANANERDGSDGSGNVLNNYADNDSANFVLATPTIDKLTPSDTTYAIGESVTWDILVTIPEGVTNGLVVTDNLPANLAYESFVVVTSAAASGGLLSNDFAGIVTSSPTVLNPSGNTRTFDFGSVTATDDNNGNNNTFLLRVTSRVENVLANQGLNSPGVATVFNNTASLVYTDGTNGATTVTDPTVPGPVEVVEPVLSLDKVAITATTGLDAGDTIQYSVTFENTGTSTAQDLILTDTLPSGLTVLSIDSISLTGGATNPGGVTGVGTGSLTGEFTVPLMGGKVVVTYTVMLGNTVTPGTDYTNAAQITWSSLDGVNANERTGTDGNQGGGTLNDYKLTDSVTASTDATFDLVKSVDKPTATIGEVLTYTLTLTLNEGTTNNVVLVDTLPVDSGVLQLEFLTGTETITYGTASTTISGSETPVVSGTVSEVLTFTLGNVVLPFGSDPDTVTITYQVVVKNVLTNQAGDVERNSADGSATGVTSDNNNTTDVTLVEPEVTAVKTITAQPADPDAGSVVSYQIVLENTSTVTAYGVTFEDILPAEMDIVTATFSATETVAGDRDSDFAVTADRIDHAGAGFDLAAGATITITYNTVILPTVVDGQSLTNNVEVEWTSRPGNPTEERTGDGLGNTGDPLNNYEDRDNSTVVANLNPIYSFTKTILSTSAPHTDASGGTDPTIEDLVIGEQVVYRLVVGMGNGTTPQVSIQDIIEATNGVLDIRSVSITTGSNLSFSGPGIAVVSDPNFDSYDEQLDIDFGTVVNNVASGSAAASQFIIDITAVVVNVIENQQGDVINNEATFSFTDEGGPLDITANVDVEIIEPVLDITKTVDNTQPQLGDTLTYTLLVTNQAGANRTDAFDIQIIDTLPTGLVMDTGSITLNILGTPATPSSIIANTSTTTGISVLLDRLDEGESVEIVYNVIVTSDITFFDAVLVNTVDMTYTSLPDGNGNINGDERGGTPDPTDPNNYIDNAQESVEIFQPDVEIVKTIDPGGAVLTPLEVFSYTLDVISVGRADALNVIVTDDISYMLANGFVFVTADNGGVLSGGVITWSLGDMQGDPVMDTAQVSFTMRAPRFLPAGFNLLPNTVEAKHDDIDPTPENNIDKVQSIVRIPPRPIPPEPEKPGRPDSSFPEGLQFDLNQNFLFDRGNLAGPGDFWSQQLNKHLEEPEVEAVQAGYIVSGLTQPGTTVRLVVYNEKGEEIGSQTTIADTGGNWLAAFNSDKVGEIPVRVEIKQTSATQNAGIDSGYDLRTYFAPASATGTYYSENLSPENVMRKRHADAVVDLYKAAGSTIRLSWNGSSYEFATQGGQLNGSGN